MIINRIYEHQNLLSLYVVSFLVGLRTYQHPCTDVFRQFISQLVREICLEIYNAMNLDDILSRSGVYRHYSFSCSGLTAGRWRLFVYAAITS